MNSLVSSESNLASRSSIELIFDGGHVATCSALTTGTDDLDEP